MTFAIAVVVLAAVLVAWIGATEDKANEAAAAAEAQAAYTSWAGAAKAATAKINATGKHWALHATAGGWQVICHGPYHGYEPKPNPASYAAACAA